jgi:small multidrug resistance family-3 protein
MQSLAWYLLAALLEIAGCFSFWIWNRHGKTAYWLIPGMMSLAGFGWALAKVDSENAVRADAAYGGVYILASLAWLWLAEGKRPDRWDCTALRFACLAQHLFCSDPGDDRPQLIRQSSHERSPTDARKSRQ